MEFGMVINLLPYLMTFSRTSSGHFELILEGHRNERQIGQTGHCIFSVSSNSIKFKACVVVTCNDKNHAQNAGRDPILVFYLRKMIDAAFFLKWAFPAAVFLFLQL